MMTTFDAAALLPDANQDTQASHHVEKRVYSTIPMNHVNYPQIYLHYNYQG